MSTILLETTSQGSMDAFSAFSGIIMLVVFFIFMYFLIIRPQRKRDKELREQMSAMKIGDTIITIGGIKGILASQDDDTVTIYSSIANTPIQLQKSAIASVTSRDGSKVTDRKQAEKKDKKEKKDIVKTDEDDEVVDDE